jgi:hypothetical protein
MSDYSITATSPEAAIMSRALREAARKIAVEVARADDDASFEGVGYYSVDVAATAMERAENKAKAFALLRASRVFYGLPEASEDHLSAVFEQDVKDALSDLFPEAYPVISFDH